MRLAGKITRSIKAPHSYSLERTYARHIALVVCISTPLLNVYGLLTLLQQKAYMYAFG